MKFHPPAGAREQPLLDPLPLGEVGRPSPYSRPAIQLGCLLRPAAARRQPCPRPATRPVGATFRQTCCRLSTPDHPHRDLLCRKPTIPSRNVGQKPKTDCRLDPSLPE